MSGRLQGKSVRELRQSAVQLGVNADDIEKARDSDTPKDALIELLQRHNASNDQDPEAQGADELLRTKSLKELRLSAVSLGIAADKIETARDSDTPKDALIELIKLAPKTTADDDGEQVMPVNDDAQVVPAKVAKSPKAAAKPQEPSVLIDARMCGLFCHNPLCRRWCKPFQADPQLSAVHNSVLHVANWASLYAPVALIFYAVMTNYVHEVSVCWLAAAFLTAVGGCWVRSSSSLTNIQSKSACLCRVNTMGCSLIIANGILCFVLAEVIEASVCDGYNQYGRSGYGIDNNYGYGNGGDRRSTTTTQQDSTAELATAMTATAAIADTDLSDRLNDLQQSDIARHLRYDVHCAEKINHFTMAVVAPSVLWW